MGYPLFPGESEHEQLLYIMEVKGLPPAAIMKVATRKHLFFDETGDPKIVPNSRGKMRYPNTKTLEDILECNDEPFLDFIRRCFEWDNSARISPEEAMRHPWIVGQP
jgi:dual specificity tyrosine-phosphorylation-regulated kinase 2/3/4